MSKIEELRVAYAASTPGEWILPADAVVQKHDADRSIYVPVGPHKNPKWVARAYGEGVLTRARPERLANAQFIALAHNLMPTLLKAVEALRECITEGGAYCFQCEADEAYEAFQRRLDAIDYIATQALAKLK